MTPMMRFFTKDYLIWKPVPTKALSLPQLMNREQLETWVYGHLLKICANGERPLHSDRPVFAPLNITMIFRILEHLFQVGYPSHWLSSIIASICEGRIATRARPPVDEVMKLWELEQTHSYLKVEMSVAAWQPEFSTHFAVWRRVLLFGVILPQANSVPLQSVREYEVSFPVFKGQRLLVLHFILLFWNIKAGNGPKPTSMFLEDLMFKHIGIGVGIDNTTWKTGIRIVTTWKFKTATRTASFWMREDVMQEMKTGNGDWKVWIWRTDNWCALTKPVDVTQNLKEGRRWLDS